MKFLPPDHPAFTPGTLWDAGKVRITGMRKFGPDKWDVDVQYVYVRDPEKTIEKDAWNFQVRHDHPAQADI